MKFPQSTPPKVWFILSVIKADWLHGKVVETLDVFLQLNNRFLFFHMSDYSASHVSQRGTFLHCPVIFVVISESQSYFSLIFWINLDFPASKILNYSISGNELEKEIRLWMK